MGFYGDDWKLGRLFLLILGVGAALGIAGALFFGWAKEHVYVKIKWVDKQEVPHERR